MQKLKVELKLATQNKAKEKNLIKIYGKRTVDKWK